MKKQLRELLIQALETELGGVPIYETALKCVVNPDLKKKWQEYLEETRQHVQILESVLEKLDIDPTELTAGRRVVHEIMLSLAKSMKLALGAGSGADPQLVAAECVALAETKDHQNWELLAEYVMKSNDRIEVLEALQEAIQEVGDQEDEHLQNSKAWSRELWMRSLGLPSVVPPQVVPPQKEEEHAKAAVIT